MTNKLLQSHIRAIKINRILMIALIVLSVICLVFAWWLQEKCYDAWVSPQESASKDSRIASISRAIALQPKKLTGYHNLLDIYMEDDILTKAEHTQLRTLLLERQGKLNYSKDNLVELYRRIGFIEISAYDNTPQQRLKAAYPYFEAADSQPHAEDLDQLVIDGYLEISRYYSDYIWLTGAVRTPAAATVTDLIRHSKAVLDSFPEECDAARLAFACALADLLTQHGENWISIVGKDTVADLAARLEQELSVAGNSPSAKVLWEELNTWNNEIHPWEEVETRQSQKQDTC